MSGLYGAEYWVPEDHCFRTGSECLEAFPEAGPAVGVVGTDKHERARNLLKEAMVCIEDGLINEKLAKRIQEFLRIL